MTERNLTSFSSQLFITLPFLLLLLDIKSRYKIKRLGFLFTPPRKFKIYFTLLLSLSLLLMNYAILNCFPRKFFPNLVNHILFSWALPLS